MQETIVAIVVAAAVVSLLKRYLPWAARRAIASALIGILHIAGLRKSAIWVEKQVLTASVSKGCSGCRSGCSNPSSKPQAREYTVKLDSLRRTAHK